MWLDFFDDIIIYFIYAATVLRNAYFNSSPGIQTVGFKNQC